MPNKIIKIFVIFLIILSCSSCGFQVVYKDDNKNIDGSLTQELASIRIQKNRTRLDQQIKSDIYDALNPDNIQTDPKYLLVLTTNKSLSSAITTSTGASGRNKIILRIDYQLKDLKTAETIASGFVITNDNYDVVTTNRYGTYVSDEYVSSNIAIVAAQKMRNSIIGDLVTIKDKKEKKKKEVNNK